MTQENPESVEGDKTVGDSSTAKNSPNTSKAKFVTFMKQKKSFFTKHKKQSGLMLLIILVITSIILAGFLLK